MRSDAVALALSEPRHSSAAVALSERGMSGFYTSILSKKSFMVLRRSNVGCWNHARDARD
jgi:hypothetical protein